MARKSILAFAAVGLLAAAGMVATALALGRFDGRLDPVLDALKGADAPDPGPLPALKLVDAFPKLRFDLPLWFGHDGTGSGWLYVVEQDGRIWRFRPEAETKELFLDLSTVVPERRRRHNEEGLLALAFHPKFKENRHFYVNYSQLKGTRPRRGVLSRFTASKDGQPTDPATEKIILEVEQPWGNHNGCSLNFGADGFLYASFGDGGAANDPHNHSQNLATLLGTVLRLDIDREENGKPYAVPRDNPFVGKDGARPEIWAYGLRNIWRMAFDAETGLLWGGDVGQNAFEEIDIIVKGGNYGWNRREGFAPFQNGEKAADMIDPVVDYPRDKGISVTGGVVYRGKVMEKLRGVYLYADYGSGRLWGVEYDHQEKKVKQHELLLHVRNAAISSFGEDPAGEVYVCGHHSGRIWRLEAEK
jgi:glucose/arabinose dehydrogenase